MDLQAPRALVALLTDFGTRDGYAGAVKGVLLARAPAVQLVDVSHQIEPGDVAGAAHALGTAAPWFPAGTVHLVVVDPGVGGPRRALALASGGQFYVGPDNGVFGPVLADPALRAHQIAAPEFAPPGASPVFHGRDLFALAAAHLARGGALAALGPALDPATLVRPPRGPAPERTGELWRARVVHVDRFGNLLTDLPIAPGPQPGARARIGGRELPLSRCYGDVPAGQLLALRGSGGCLEIACNGASAAALLGLGRGAVVEFAAVGAC